MIDSTSPYDGTFFKGAALPDSCRTFGTMPRDVLHEACFAAYPQRWPIAFITAHPAEHTDMLRAELLHLCKLKADEKIPKLLRGQPELFFFFFRQQTQKISNKLQQSGSSQQQTPTETAIVAVEAARDTAVTAGTDTVVRSGIKHDGQASSAMAIPEFIKVLYNVCICNTCMVFSHSVQ